MVKNHSKNLFIDYLSRIQVLYKITHNGNYIYILTYCMSNTNNNFNYAYNNDHIKGINNKIKVLNHVAYGYHNFKNYKNLILLHFACKPVEPQKKKSQNKTHVSAA